MGGENWQRVILHADMDAFFAAVEQRDHPELRGRPIVVGGTSRRGVVSTASYEARQYGLRSAMPMVEALKRCPHVVVVSPDFKRYKEASNQIMEVFRRYSPLVEPISIDEAFIDITGTRQLLGHPEEVGRQIKRDVLKETQGLIVSVGLAPNKYLAKVASDHDKPDGFTVVSPGTERAFLWPLSVDKLWGVGPKSRDRIEGMGLKTIEDVAHTDISVLVRELGTFGAHIWDLANGNDPRAVEPREEAKSVGKEFTLERDIIGEDKIVPHLKRGAQEIAGSLRGKGLVAGGVRVKLKTNKFKSLTRQSILEPPSDSGPTLMEVARRLLPQFDLSQPMRLVGITAFNLRQGANVRQGELFVDKGVEQNHRLDKAMDAVLDRFGRDALKRGDDLD